jgi:ABC-2 type transport system permease protein
MANVNGKFLGAFDYSCDYSNLYILSSLGMPEGNVDMGSTVGSYFGLLFLSSSVHSA